MAMTRSHSASLIRMARLSRAMPALLTTMSMRPSPSMVESTMHLRGGRVGDVRLEA